jgi:hypothetical protein
MNASDMIRLATVAAPFRVREKGFGTQAKACGYNSGNAKNSLP